MFKAEITGVDKADKLLKSLDYSVSTKIVGQGIKEAAKPFISDAKTKVPKKTGKLADSIRAKILRDNNKNIAVGVAPYSKKGKGFHYTARFIEFGVSGIAKKAKMFRKALKTKEGKFIKLGSGKRYRKDQPARPFMRPAFYSNRERINENIKRHILRVLAVKIKKELGSNTRIARVKNL